MLERRKVRSENVYVAAQLYLEGLAQRHACETVVLATADGLPVAGVGSEVDLTVVGALASSPARASERGVHRLELDAGRGRFCVGAVGPVAARFDAECAAGLARILA